jgi:hypothetical protein
MFEWLSKSLIQVNWIVPKAIYLADRQWSKKGKPLNRKPAQVAVFKAKPLEQIYYVAVIMKPPRPQTGRNFLFGSGFAKSIWRATI